jgi:DNA-binding PadR family transcriptional regulator
VTRDLRSLTDFEQVLLGYMAREAYSGYGLKRIFSTTPAMVYQPSPGALYPALRRLVSRGLLSVEDTVPPGGRPQRLYRATEEGRAAHQEWLGRPVDPATVANDLGLHLMRLAMMDDRADREMARSFLAGLASALESFVAGLESYLANGGNTAGLFGALAVEHGIAVHRASLDWARSALSRLGMPGESLAACQD